MLFHTGALIGRLLLAQLFLWEGIVLFNFYGPSVMYVERFGVPGALLPAAIAAQLGGAIMLILGWCARVAALGLALFCVLAAMIFHMNLADPNQVLHLQKDLALAGGLLVLAAFGPGRWALRPTPKPGA